MTPATLASWAFAHGLTAGQLARLAGVAGARTVRRWYSGEREIPGPLVQLIRVINSMKTEHAKATIAMLVEG